MLLYIADFYLHCSAEIEELAGKFGVGTPTLQHIIDGLRQPTDHDIRVSKYRTKISVFIICRLANNQSQGLKAVECLVVLLHVCRKCKLTLTLSLYQRVSQLRGNCRAASVDKRANARSVNCLYLNRRIIYLIPSLQ